MSTVNDVTQRVRAHPLIADSEVGKLADDNFASAVSQLILVCLNDLGERLARDIGKRYYSFTDPTVVAGVLDSDLAIELEAFIADEGLLLEGLGVGRIKVDSYDLPLIPLGSSEQGAMGGAYDNIFPHYWLNGTKLFTRGPEAGDAITFACPRNPTLSELSPQLEDDLVNLLVLRLRATQPTEANAT